MQRAVHTPPALQPERGRGRHVATRFHQPVWTPRRETSTVSESAPLMRPPVCEAPPLHSHPSLPCIHALASACTWPSPHAGPATEGNAPTVSPDPALPPQPLLSPHAAPPPALPPYKAEVTASGLPREEGEPSSGRQRRRRRRRSRRARRNRQAAARRGAARQHYAAAQSFSVRLPGRNSTPMCSRVEHHGRVGGG